MTLDELARLQVLYFQAQRDNNVTASEYVARGDEWYAALREISFAALAAERREMVEALRALLFDAEQFAKAIPPYQNAESIAQARAILAKVEK